MKGDTIRNSVDKLRRVPEDIPAYDVDNETLVQQIHDLSDALKTYGYTEQEVARAIFDVFRIEI